MTPFKPQNFELPTTEQGIFKKFHVARTDGSDLEGGKHADCQYFVIDITHDKYAPAAMQAYALACGLTHPQLAKDIEAMCGESPDRVDAYGVRPNGEMVLVGGTMMPPSMKAKDLIREYFGHGDFEDQESYHSILADMFEQYEKYLLTYHNKG
jgi:hypothetical protein